jgi:RecG-like helicase
VLHRLRSGTEPEREPSGFAIAEADLRLRGMGELAGLRQSGLAGEEEDLGLLVLARDLMRADPGLRERYDSKCEAEYVP